MTATVTALPVDYDDVTARAVALAEIGGFQLVQVSERECWLTGPDHRFPHAWVLAHLPAGDWFAESPRYGPTRFRMAFTL